MGPNSVPCMENGIWVFARPSLCSYGSLGWRQEIWIPTLPPLLSELNMIDLGRPTRYFLARRVSAATTTMIAFAFRITTLTQSRPSAKLTLSIPCQY